MHHSVFFSLSASRAVSARVNILKMVARRRTARWCCSSLVRNANSNVFVRGLRLQAALVFARGPEKFPGLRYSLTM